MGGACLGLAYPNSTWIGLAWLGPSIILFSSIGKNGWEAFRLGYAAGMVQSLITLRWMLNIPYPSGAISGWLALCSYLAVYTGLWVWITWRMFPISTQNGTSNHITAESIRWFARSTLSQRALWTFLAATFWVANEMVTSRFLTGFPWMPVGLTQSSMLPLIQISSLTGIYGVSFIVLWFSVSALASLLSLIQKPLQKHTGFLSHYAWIGCMALPMLAVGGAMIFGIYRLANGRSPTSTVRLALVQPSIPQTMIWNEKDNQIRFQKLIELSRLALATDPDVLVWPEAAVPTMLRHDATTANTFSALLKQHKSWAIVGSDDATVGPSGSPQDTRFYNSSFVINPDGVVQGIYNKRRLVIFGEYVPLLKWLPFLKYLTPIGQNGFTAGDKPVVFRIPIKETKHSILVSPLICFEDAFPHSVGEYVHEDTDFLLNLTNDGWFGESNAHWQHAAHAIFRAVENNIPVVSCANNGLTCWFDSLGRTHQLYFGESKDVYGVGFKNVEIPILDGEKRAMTFYHAHGDVFGWGCVSILLAALFRHLRQSWFTKKAALQ